MDDLVKSMLEGVPLDDVPKLDEVYEGALFVSSTLKESDRGNFSSSEKWELQKRDGTKFNFTDSFLLYPEEFDLEEWGPNMKRQAKRHLVDLGVLTQDSGYPTLRGQQDDRRTVAEKIVGAINAVAAGKTFTIGLKDDKDGRTRLSIRKPKK